jgi:hypothetical protein
MPPDGGRPLCEPLSRSTRGSFRSLWCEDLVVSIVFRGAANGSSPPAAIIRSDLGAVEVQVGPRRRGAALILVSGAVDGGTVRVFSGGTGSE